jgi:ubiquinone/menaquinone biosynthesis C-methylase UbiE
MKWIEALKMQSRGLWYGLTPTSRYRLRYLIFFPLDLYDRLTGNTHRYAPSRGQIFTGGSAGARGFIEFGKHQLSLLQQYTSLAPSNEVLDIGCGLGRTAAAFTEYLTPYGSYHGFDVVEYGIEWCKDRIGSDHSNFKFTHVPLYNDLYRATGKDAASFKFPYEDASFDLQYSFSVFTHMKIDEIKNYLLEMQRIKKPGGQCFSTFFLYNDVNEDYITNKSTFNFPIQRDGHRLMSDETISGNIAIHENTLRSMLHHAGFHSYQIVHGFWKESQYDGTIQEYQDIVVFW